MHNRNDVVIYVEAGVATNALVISSSTRADILPGTATDAKNPPPVVEHLNLVLVPENTQGVTNLTSIAHGFFLRTVFGVRPLRDGDSAGFKEFVETPPATVRAMRATINQLDVQLAGCGVAASGATFAPAAQPGQYAYSASYGEVLDLRAKYDALLAKNAAGNPSAADLDAVAAEQQAADATANPPAAVAVGIAAAPVCRCAEPAPVAALNGVACGGCGGDIVPAAPVIEHHDPITATVEEAQATAAQIAQPAEQTEAHPV